MGNIFAARRTASLVVASRPMAKYPPFGGDAAERPQSVRASLNYFNIYRLIVASLFLLAILVYPKTLGLGTQDPILFAWTSLLYWLLALFFYFALKHLKLDFNLLLVLQVVSDILALTLMMYASGGSKSGLSVLLLVVLAGAGLVGQGRLTLFFAALATVAVLVEQSLRVLEFGGDSADFVQTGIVCIGFFATAITARLLASRVIANEELARQRGIDLANQLSIGERVIRDMQDGVLVVDVDQKVRQFNPQAETLLGVRAPSWPDLAVFSVALTEGYTALDQSVGEVATLLRVPGNGNLLRVRYVRTGESGDVLIYLEDMGRIQAQAQQLKLAALGRLTANIAHEIRNPLAAISHAAELLREERRAEGQARLSVIINDNAQRLDRLVTDILELGRRDRAEPEAIKLPAFLESFLDEFAAHEKTDRAIVVQSAELNTVMYFDRAHLNQVLWNLLSNALRYCSGKSGAVRVEVRNNTASRRVELHIIDDGMGISAESGNKIFEPFFTTHSQGTGLGLYIARELCEANDALLEWVNNEPGAHFCIAGRSREWQQNQSVENGQE